jgi:hypothetical protein
MAEVLSTVFVIIHKILQHHEEIRVMKDELGRCINYVRLLEPLLVKFQRETPNNNIDQPAGSLSWLTNLHNALNGLDETITYCIKNPIRASLLPSRYTNMLKEALECIKDAMGIVGMATNAMTVETKNAMGCMSDDIHNIGDVLAELEAKQSDMLNAMRSNQVELLEAIASAMSIQGGAEELKSQLASQEQFYIDKLKTEKESRVRIELEAAIQISRVAGGNMCPKEYQCPISLEIMEDPVILVQSGMTYDRKPISVALAINPGTDPMTNIKFNDEPKLVPNYSLKSLIETWKRHHMAGSIEPHLQPPPPPPISGRSAEDTTVNYQ